MKQISKMRRKVKKEIIEWVVFFGIIGILYVTGLHTTVFGTIQRGLLATGIMKPDLDGDTREASYDLILVDMEGNELDLTDWKSETIFMNYWATWCPPCIAEMPDINNLYNQTKDEVKFAMISVDDDRDKAKAFVKRKGFDFPVYFVKSYIPEVYATNSIPTTYVISPEGKIVVSRYGMAKYSGEEFVGYLKKL